MVVLPSEKTLHIVDRAFNLGMFANQCIPKFSGDTDSGKGDSKTFADWKERFGIV